MPTEIKCQFGNYVWWVGANGGYQIGQVVMANELDPVDYKTADGELFYLVQTWPNKELVIVCPGDLSEYLGDANNPRRKQVERDLAATEKADINTLVENALGPTIDAAVRGN